MNCGDINILINRELDGRLTAQERQELYRHLTLCPECAAAYGEWQRLDALLRQRIGAVEPPADLAAGVMAALPEQAPLQPVKPVPIRRRKNRWLVLAAVAAGLLLATVWSGLFDASDQPPLAPDPQLAEEQEDPPQPAPPEEEDPVVAEEDPVEQGTEDPAAGEGEGQEQETEPPEVTPPPPPQTYNNGIPLPSVASGETSQGEYSLFTLSYQEYDALLPRIIDNTVTYYVDADGIYLEYQVLLDGSAAPAFVGETESLPTAAGIGGFTDESSSHDYSYITAWSPDGLTRAVNQGGDTPGLYLQPAQEQAGPVSVDGRGGGRLVCWAPDGNKVLFTDAADNLYLYYLAEQVCLTLYDGKAGSACWSGDSAAVVFSGLDAATGHYSIFRVSVP